jgi:hypothetical protein
METVRHNFDEKTILGRFNDIVSSVEANWRARRNICVRKFVVGVDVFLEDTGGRGDEDHKNSHYLHS